MNNVTVKNSLMALWKHICSWGHVQIYIHLLFVTGKKWLEISTNKKFVYSGNIFPKMPIMKQCQKNPQKIAKFKTFVTLQGNIQFQGTAYQRHQNYQIYQEFSLFDAK